MILPVPTNDTKSIKVMNLEDSKSMFKDLGECFDDDYCLDDYDCNITAKVYRSGSYQYSVVSKGDLSKLNLALFKLDPSAFEKTVSFIDSKL